MVPGVDQGRVSVVAYPQAAKCLDPADGSLHHPADSPQVAAMRSLTSSNLRLDTQKSQEGSGSIAVVTGICQKQARVLPRATSRAA